MEARPQESLTLHHHLSPTGPNHGKVLRLLVMSVGHCPGASPVPWVRPGGHAASTYGLLDTSQTKDFKELLSPHFTEQQTGTQQDGGHLKEGPSLPRRGHPKVPCPRGEDLIFNRSSPGRPALRLEQTSPEPRRKGHSGRHAQAPGPGQGHLCPHPGRLTGLSADSLGPDWPRLGQVRETQDKTPSTPRPRGAAGGSTACSPWGPRGCSQC